VRAGPDQARRAQVLYLTEPIDEPAISAVADYEEHKFVDVTREGLELAGDAEDGKKKARRPPRLAGVGRTLASRMPGCLARATEGGARQAARLPRCRPRARRRNRPPAAQEEATTALKPLTDFLKATLGERVEKVVVSGRLADSPCALVTSKFGWSAYQERIFKSQARRRRRRPWPRRWPVQAGALPWPVWQAAWCRPRPLRLARLARAGASAAAGCSRRAPSAAMSRGARS